MRPGERLDRYVIERMLGEGGMATVYLGRHEKLGSAHALKVLRVDVPAIRARLVAEGRVQSGIRHPNVVSVTDILETGSAVALVMEFVDGPALDEYQREQPLPLEEAVELFRGIVLGVAEAHRTGVVHRDLKSANVLLHRTSNAGVIPKVTDFGLVKVFESSGTKSGVTMGTPEYMSPEQVRDSGKVDPRSDLWSLGVLLYEMLTGDVPFDGGDLLQIYNAIAHAKYTPVQQVRPDVPDWLAAIIDDLLVVDPAGRIQTGEGIVARLDAGQRAPSAVPTTSVVPGSTGLKGALGGVALLGALGAIGAVALAAALGFYLLQPAELPPKRDVVVDIRGVPEGMEHAFTAGRFRFDGAEPLQIPNRNVPGTLKLTWAYGPQCTTCPERCPSWCARGEQVVDLVPGQGAQEVVVDLPPVSPVRDVVVETGQPLVLATLGDLPGVIQGTRATFSGVAPGGHSMHLEVGTCPEVELGCHEREACPPGCVSSQVMLGVQPGDGPFVRPFPLPAPAPTPVPVAPMPVAPTVAPTPVAPVPVVVPRPRGGALVTGPAFGRFIDANPDWAKEAAIAAGRADDSYMSDWLDGPPAGPVDRIPWAAAMAYCASRGGLPGLDDPPATWSASSAVKQEWRDAGGRPGWRRFDGVPSTNADPDESFAYTGFRCKGG